MKILRWILFLPITISLSGIINFLLLYLKLALVFVWDNAFFPIYRWIIPGIENSNEMIIISILDYLFPAIALFFAIRIGTYIAPDNKKIIKKFLSVFAVVFIIYPIIKEDVNLFMGISFIVGAVASYFDD